jgi:hypothetical protein
MKGSEMKATRSLFTTLIMAGLVLIAAAGSCAASADHSGHTGQLIHESTVQEYRMAYHLLELPGRADLHLIVYITAPDGQAVENATVGYLVKGPDGASQKAMAMKMDKSFGADVNFSPPGDYLIKVKAVVGEVKLLDSFSHSIP